MTDAVSIDYQLGKNGWSQLTPCQTQSRSGTQGPSPLGVKNVKTQTEQNASALRLIADIEAVIDFRRFGPDSEFRPPNGEALRLKTTIAQLLSGRRTNRVAPRG